MRPGTNGPRSLMRTMVVRPLSRFVTRANAGMGSVVFFYHVFKDCFSHEQLFVYFLLRVAPLFSYSIQ